MPIFYIVFAEIFKIFHNVNVNKLWSSLWFLIYQWFRTLCPVCIDFTICLYFLLRNSMNPFHNPLFEHKTVKIFNEIIYLNILFVLLCRSLTPIVTQIWLVSYVIESLGRELLPLVKYEVESWAGGGWLCTSCSQCSQSSLLEIWVLQIFLPMWRSRGNWGTVPD